MSAVARDPPADPHRRVISGSRPPVAATTGTRATRFEDSHAEAFVERRLHEEPRTLTVTGAGRFTADVTNQRAQRIPGDSIQPGLYIRRRFAGQHELRKEGSDAMSRSCVQRCATFFLGSSVLKNNT
jgi:hypothetical protein